MSVLQYRLILMNNIDVATDSVSTNSADKIKHDGIIDKIDAEYVRVRILQTSACSSCKIANRCMASESKEKLIDIFGVKDADKFNIGQEVTVCTSSNMAFMALLYGFVIPLLILISVILIVVIMDKSEALAAMLGIVSLIPYYFLIFLFRKKLSYRIRFWIEEK